MAVMPNIGVSGPSQVSTNPKENALQTPTHNGVRNARKINLFWKLEAYFMAVGIMDEFQKVNTVSFSLKDITLIWWRYRREMPTESSHLSPLGMDLKGNLSGNSILRMQKGKAELS